MEISECPQCGATATPSDRSCGYCKAEFFVTSIAYLGNLEKNAISKYLSHYKKLVTQDKENIEGLLGLGLCYLQMGNFPAAQGYFKKIIEISPDVSEAYYYNSLSLIKGRRVMTLNLNEIREIETYLNTAMQIDDQKPHYKLLLAMVKRDYYETSGMRAQPPTAAELLGDIVGAEIISSELDHLTVSVEVSNQEGYYSELCVI